jgi:hypothetical protein
LKVADSVFYADKYIESIPFYREFMRVHTSHEAIPYAEYQIAQAYFHAYQGLSHDVTPIKEARKSFSNVVEKYPQSTWSVFAEEQILECDKLLFSSEMNVIEFYEKKGLETAARARLETAKSNYSHLEELESVTVDSTYHSGETTAPIPVDEPSRMNEILNHEGDTTDPDVFNTQTVEADENVTMTEERIESNFSIENYEFLRSISCDSNEHISRLVLYFKTKPYVYSSRQNRSSLENKSKKYENIILIQNHAALHFASPDLETLDSGNSIVREFESCGSSLDQIRIDEIIMNPHTDLSDPEGYVNVKLSSKTERKVKMLSFSEPERIILVFE